MDTVSAYMALLRPLDNLVPKDKRREYYETYHQWFSRRVCKQNKKDFVDARCRGEVWRDEGR